MKTAKPPIAGDWVAHAPGAPQKVCATAASLKSIEELLKRQNITLEDVEVYQVPVLEDSFFIGGGELQVFGRD